MNTLPSRAGGREGSRFSALDGLRGVAALVVVLHHLSMFLPAMAAAFEPSDVDPGAGMAWWLERTPLKLLTMGPEAVAVFFVLSGFVLARPVVRGRVRWTSYYPQRIVRLGVPWLGAVALAAAIVMLQPQLTGHQDSSWVAEVSVDHLRPHTVLAALDPVRGDFSLDPPLWSLRWELWFSLLLPAYVVVAVALKRWWLPSLALVVLVSTLGQAHRQDVFVFMPMFLVGALLAASEDRISTLVRHTDRRGDQRVWTVMLIVGLGVFCLSWCTGVLPRDNTWTRFVLYALWSPAAGLVVISTMGDSWIRRSLAAPAAQWLGRISFSLYLTHLPVLLGVWFALRAVPVGPRLVLAAVAILVTAVLFERVVERPGHRLSRWVGARLHRTGRDVPRVVGVS